MLGHGKGEAELMKRTLVILPQVIEVYSEQRSIGSKPKGIVKNNGSLGNEKDGDPKK